MLFTGLLGMGAAPAMYRGLSFSFAHPMLSQAVALSLVGTVLYTAWSNRRKIEVYARLLIDQATLARVVSQDRLTSVFLQQRYVDACAEALLLRYSVQVTRQRLAALRVAKTREGLENDLDDGNMHNVDGEDDNAAAAVHNDSAYRDKKTLSDLEQACEELSDASAKHVTALQRHVGEMMQAWGLMKIEGEVGGEWSVCEVHKVEEALDRRQDF